MRLLFVWPLLAGAIVVASAESDDCPRTLINTYYAELGCVPRKENDAPCPTSFDCTQYESRDKSKCHYGGKAYSIREGIGSTPFGSCKAACVCQDGVEGADPSFTCANIECPVGLFIPSEPGCRYLYQPGKCCSSDKTCGESVKNATVTCEYNNQSYIEGERFYGDDCRVCHCKENFKGVLEEPFCYNLKCDYELHSADRIRSGCVPIYYETKGCCPISWQCPDKDDKILKKKTKIRQRTQETCKFGDLELEAGQELETAGSNIFCSCKTPPYLTCFQSAETA